MSAKQYVTITNLTDIATPVLKQYRLDNQHLEVCGQLLAPGKSLTVTQEAWGTAKTRYARLCTLGALCVGDVPAAYLDAHAARPAHHVDPEDI